MAEVVASDGVRLNVEVHGPAEAYDPVEVHGPAEAYDPVEVHGPAEAYDPVSTGGHSILFSCGLCTTLENWRPQVAPLTAAGHRVILWDFRGHGRSDAPAEPAAYSMTQVVDDMGRVLDHVEPDRPVVLAGLSFGGLASLHYTLARPERVAGLVLAGSGPGFKKPEAQARWEAMVERTASFLETKGCQAFVESKAAVTAIGLRPELPAAQAAARAIAAQNPAGLACFARRVAGPAPSVIDDLARIQAPALVLVGEKDEAYLRAADVMADRLANARRTTLARAGHIANIEEADAFNEAVLGFLSDLPPAPSAPEGSSDT
jgi:pimeloyl-ACP methyl ester carboxylesterase